MNEMAQIKLIQQKILLRKELRLKLRQLQPHDRHQQSERITQKVLAHPKYQESHGIAVFLSMPDELDTTNIIKDIFASGKRCFIPRYSETSTEMTMVHIASLSDMQSLPKTKWNIPQPLESEEHDDCLKTGGLDLILAPGLAFTRDGWRLGRGKGYYDNFLNLYGAKFSHPYTIGLALRQCIVDHIPTTLNDVQLDEIISSD